MVPGITIERLAGDWRSCACGYCTPLQDHASASGKRKPECAEIPPLVLGPGIVFAVGIVWRSQAAARPLGGSLLPGLRAALLGSAALALLLRLRKLTCTGDAELNRLRERRRVRVEGLRVHIRADGLKLRRSLSPKLHRLRQHHSHIRSRDGELETEILLARV